MHANMQGHTHTYIARKINFYWYLEATTYLLGKCEKRVKITFNKSKLTYIRL